MENENTFGDYIFPKWVTKNTQDMIISFWGQAGRTYKDWLEQSEFNVSEFCYYIPCQGFKVPPFGSRVHFMLRDDPSIKGEYKYRVVEGLYIHRWNGLGTVIDDDGKEHYVSTCERWVRELSSKDLEKINNKPTNQ